MLWIFAERFFMAALRQCEKSEGCFAVFTAQPWTAAVLFKLQFSDGLLVKISLKLHDYGFGIDLVFFGFACLVYGYLLFRSGYFPRTLGVLMAIAGLSYLANSFTLIFAPVYAGRIFLILVLALIGELSLCLWLIVKGVNVQRWKEQASAAGEWRS